MHCAIKFCYNLGNFYLGKTIPETVNLMEKAYKNKCFGKSMSLRWHGNIKKIYVSLQNWVLNLADQKE